MKALVIYYSLEGNTKMIADAIKEEIDCDIARLIPRKDIPKKGFLKYFFGGKQVLLRQKPKLKSFNNNFEAYDLIIFGSPVWAGSYVPAFNTLFSQANIINKKIALFCTYRGNEGKIFKRFNNKLIGNEIIGQIGFVSPLENNAVKNSNKAKQWIRQFIK
ncbi:flavodoxin family protein [Thermohalobacter berrensis]|uniref:Flavodoxin n=1 Tax=Thermohalobacter berrensis TaxID=99594 RepID=A0A419T797_9FIRM|nr:NAD(P)H-dependent oxidoreductase [Thermohalobacter berrensis]RKD33434.1 flavodoxin [Thermohalobacter berrensis]